MDLAERVRGLSVVDATCGAGGNSIAFARAGCAVTAVERDFDRLELARHNAKIYGVDRQIDFHCGDAVDLLPKLKADVLFVDPPWGTEWDRERTTLEEMPLLSECLKVEGFARLFAKVPPSFDPSTTPGARAEACFGHRPGDQHRVKFVLLQVVDFKTARNKLLT